MLPVFAQRMFEGIRLLDSIVEVFWRQDTVSIVLPINLAYKKWYHILAINSSISSIF